MHAIAAMANSAGSHAALDAIDGFQRGAGAEIAAGSPK